VAGGVSSTSATPPTASRSGPGSGGVRSRAVEADHRPERSRLTLPRGARVTLSREVRRAFDRGRSAADGPVVVYAFDRGDGRPARMALVVGRRWGGAVRRNRVRRLLREAFRTARPDLPVGHDLILVPRDALHALGMAAVRRHLRGAARRAVARLAREGPREPDPGAARRRRR